MMQAANDNSAPANAGALTFASVCSGIEAASVAFNPLGWRAVCFSEIEKFPSAVLSHHYPDVPNLGDFTKIDTRALPHVDILCGGTPCQAFSVAGLRQSLEDARGNLSLEFVRLAHELAGNGITNGNGLRNVVWENVPGVLSTKDNAFGCFLAGLVGATDALPPPKGRRWPNAGMVAGPKGRAAWRVLDAQFFGLAQRRKRVIVVADFGNGADPAAVLFEPESVRRDSPPSRETGEGVAAAVAPSLTASGRGVERTGDTRGQDPVVAVLRGHSDYGDGLPSIRAEGGDCAGGSEALVAYAPEIARCDATREGSSQDYESTTMVAVVHGTQDPCTSETTAFALGRNNGGENVIAFSAKDYGADASVEIAPTLRAGGHTNSHANAGVMPAIAFLHCNKGRPNGRQSKHTEMVTVESETIPTLTTDGHAQSAVAMSVALRGREGGATAELGGEVATALRASSGGGDKPHVLVDGIPEVAGTMKACAGKTGGFSNSADHAAAGYMVPVTTSAVRRLTPRECERLQGFQFLVHPDYPGAWLDDAGRWWSPDYTLIPWRNKPAEQCPDGPRYKALGNSWAVPLFTWLGKRITAHMPPIVSNDNNKQDVERAAA